MKTNSVFKKSVLASSVAAIVLGVTACGGGSGGSDKASKSEVQMSGAVVDDYVAFARVYVDVNKNNRFDFDFEPYAFTDEDGYFSVSKQGENYCELDKADYAFRHCLQADSELQNGGVIRVEDGRDLLTTLLYNSAMSLLMDGSGSGLRVSALSTGVSALSDDGLIEAAKKVLSMTDDEVQSVRAAFISYLTTYLIAKSGSDLNQIDPLVIDSAQNAVDETDRAFKLAIQFHKIVESIAERMVPETLTDSSGNTLEPKDVVGAIYFALIKNMPIESNGEDVFSYTVPTSGSAIDFVQAAQDAAALANEVYASFTGRIKTADVSDIVRLNQFLNCALSNEGDEAIDKDNLDTDFSNSTSCTEDHIATDSDENARVKLFAAELATKATVDEIGQLLVTAFENSKTIVEDDAGFDAEDNDFTASSEKVNAGGEPSAPVVSFDDVINRFETHHLTLAGEPGVDSFEVYFEDDDRTDDVNEGAVTVCQQDGESGEQYLFNGRWTQDQEQPHIVYMTYLNIPVTLKQLDGEADANANSCDYSPTCLTMSYNNLDEGTSSEEPVLTQVYTNEESLTSDDSSIMVLTNSIPTEADQCFLGNR